MKLSMFFLTFIERKDAFIVSKVLPSLNLTEKYSNNLVINEDRTIQVSEIYKTCSMKEDRKRK